MANTPILIHTCIFQAFVSVLRGAVECVPSNIPVISDIVMQISKELFSFLESLKANNNRDWFKAHKSEFDAHNADVKAFFREVENGLQSTDRIDKHSVFRIYRDVRFAKDKSPYKTGFSGYFRRATAARRGSYYLKISPGNSFVGGGFYGPNADDLKRIRQEFEIDDSEMRDVINDPTFVQYFGEIKGNELKTAPKGFDKTHPAIDLIRKKQFYLERTFTDEEVLSERFIEDVVETFQGVRPFFDSMSSILTTDLNGESVL